MGYLELPIKVEHDIEIKMTGALVARPGDTLVIGVFGVMSAQEFDVMREQWRSMLPDDIHVLIVEQCSALAIATPRSEG